MQEYNRKIAGEESPRAKKRREREERHMRERKELESLQNSYPFQGERNYAYSQKAQRPRDLID